MVIFFIFFLQRQVLFLPPHVGELVKSVEAAKNFQQMFTALDTTLKSMGSELRSFSWKPAAQGRAWQLSTADMEAQSSPMSEFQDKRMGAAKEGEQQEASVQPDKEVCHCSSVVWVC
jgi:hypothetical protein